MAVPFLIIISYIIFFEWVGGFILVTSMYFRLKSKVLLYLDCATFFGIIWALIMIIGFTLMSDEIYELSLIFIALALFSASLFVDLVRDNKINVSRAIFNCSLAVATIAMVFFTDSMHITIIGNDITTIWNPTSLIFALLIVLSIVYALFNAFIRIWLKIKGELKKVAAAFLISLVIIGPVMVGLYLIYGLVWGLIAAHIGLAIIGLLLLKNPQLLYVLPYEVHRIIVIERESGKSLYDYKWIASSTDAMLVSGLLRALDSISAEALKVGEIKEIVLEQGTLIINTSDVVMVGLLAADSSTLLRDCLAIFTEKFVEKFRDQLNIENNYEDVYGSANEIISEVFKYITPRI